MEHNFGIVSENFHLWKWRQKHLSVLVVDLTAIYITHLASDTSFVQSCTGRFARGTAEVGGFFIFEC